MTDTERGLIHTRRRIEQVCVFEGMKFGSGTPTDIDFLMEIRGKGYIIGEMKYGDTKVPAGQSRALHQMATDLESAGKKVLVFIAQHWQNGDIHVADARVVAYKSCGQPHYPTENITVHALVHDFITLELGLNADLSEPTSGR